MALQTLANLAQIVSAAAVVAALVFGLVQIRQFREQRRDTVAAELIRSFQDAQFTRSFRIVSALPRDAPAEQLRAGGETMEDAALWLGMRYEMLGLLVYRRIMPLSLVAELSGGVAIDLWSKMRNWVLLVRREQSRGHILEWFQWLAEQLEKTGRDADAPAYEKYRDWRRPRE